MKNRPECGPYWKEEWWSCLEGKTIMDYNMRLCHQWLKDYLNVTESLYQRSVHWMAQVYVLYKCISNNVAENFFNEVWRGWPSYKIVKLPWKVWWILAIAIDTCKRYEIECIKITECNCFVFLFVCFFILFFFLISNSVPGVRDQCCWIKAIF